MINSERAACSVAFLTPKPLPFVNIGRAREVVHRAQSDSDQMVQLNKSHRLEDGHDHVEKTRHRLLVSSVFSRACASSSVRFGSTGPTERSYGESETQFVGVVGILAVLQKNAAYD